MKATFNVKISIDNHNVVTKIGTTEGMEDMEITLMQNVLKVMADVNKKVKQQVDRFYNEPDSDVDPTETAEEPAENQEATVQE